ncbi:MAG: efflux RND transporter periplasmic adaptor subunit [Candidatus Electrothrix sp. GW3-4]|uniref:efflux RND transporter periplasmic adaptor subunit n=1 Tax=Candidatus Electrothrix sp. GW3-4 TaxID=3126740 RepID=UPI0030D08962
MKSNEKLTKTPAEQPDISAILQSSHKRGGKGRFCLLLLLLCCAAGAFLYFRQQGPETPDPQLSFKTEPVTINNLVVTVTATGNLEPTNKVDVGSEISGKIEAVMADFNDQVTEGQVLARLDVSKLMAKVKQTEASLQAAKARILQAKATIEETGSNLRKLRKVYKLSNGKMPSQSDMDTARAAHARAKADLASAEAGVAEVQASLDITRTDLAKAEIISPVNGVVLSRKIEKGQTVAASFEAPVLFELAEDLTKMELHVAVDEADIGQVRDGQEAVFTVDAYPERKFSAVISQVHFAATTTTDSVVTYETVLLMENSDLALRPGMTATAEIVVQEVRDALTVPNAALRFTPLPRKKGSRSRPCSVRSSRSAPDDDAKNSRSLSPKGISSMSG